MKKFVILALALVALAFAVPVVSAGELALVGYQQRCDGRGHCWQEAVYAEAVSIQAVAVKMAAPAEVKPMPVGSGPVTVYAAPVEFAAIGLRERAVCTASRVLATPIYLLQKAKDGIQCHREARRAKRAHCRGG